MSAHGDGIALSGVAYESNQLAASDIGTSLPPIADMAANSPCYIYAYPSLSFRATKHHQTPLSPLFDSRDLVHPSIH